MAQRLHAAARAVASGGRVMRVDTLHLTLAFIGEVEASALTTLRAVGPAVAARHAAFSWTPDALGYWPHNHVLWAGSCAPSAPLTALANDLRRALRAAGVAVERRPFKAHVTLARQMGSPDRLPPLELNGDWPVSELRLMSSVWSPRGADYVALCRWPLSV